MSAPVIALLAHQHPSLVARTVRALAPLRVIVHVDGQADIAPFERALRDESSRVEFTARRVEVGWASISMVRAMTSLLDSALRTSYFRPSSHLVFLSGACYPLKPAGEIAAVLGGSPTTQYCRAITVRPSSAEHSWKIDRRHYYELQRSLARSPLTPRGAKAVCRSLELLDRRPVRVPRPVYVGSQWIALTRACLESIHDSILATAAALEYAFAPDELVFQTAFHRSAWAAGTQNPDDTRTGRNARPADLSNLHLLDPSMSKVFSSADFQRIAASDKLFVRKVDPRSAPLLDRIDRRLLGAAAPYA